MNGDRILHAHDDGGILEHHPEDTSQYKNYDGKILDESGDGILDVSGGDDVDEGIPCGKAFCDIHIEKTSEIQNVNAGVLRNVQDDVEIQYGNDDDWGILNGNGYEILGVCGFGENADEYVH